MCLRHKINRMLKKAIRTNDIDSVVIASLALEYLNLVEAYETTPCE